MNNLLDFIRGSVRPIVTLQFTTVLSAIIVKWIWSTPFPPVPVEIIIGLVSAFTTTVATVVAFWFAQRSNGAVPHA